MYRTFLSAGNDCYNAVEAAIKHGYRLIDTACAYRNHKQVGAAIKKCIDEGVVKREDLFITTKLWVCDYKPEDVEAAIKVSLEDLGLEYVDLVPIHQAGLFDLSPEVDKRRHEGYFFDYEVFPGEDCHKIGFDLEKVMGAWKKLEELYQRVGEGGLF